MYANNILPFKPKDKAVEGFNERLKETERLTLQIINDQPVTVKGVEYSMNDVITLVATDTEGFEELKKLLQDLLYASDGDELACASRLNRFLIASTHEMCFRLSGDVQKAREWEA